MRWEDERRSSNVEDERGGGGGGFGGIPIIGGGLGTIVIVLIALFFGIDPRSLFQGGNQSTPRTTQQAPAQPGQPGQVDRQKDFVSAVLGDTEDVWTAIFQQKLGRQYQDPHLVLFTDSIRSACGFAQSASGPFYCPSDEKVYLDTSFFDELDQRFHAPGDFAKAYVIAHEVGHHVQNLLGISDKVRQAEERSDKVGANALSVRLELQADCYAGVWGYNAQKMRNILEPGDVESALAAATAIGDDHLQRDAGRRVNPDAFTHGTSAQRVFWFKRGFESGDPKGCDTFARGAVQDSSY